MDVVVDVYKHIHLIEVKIMQLRRIQSSLIKKEDCDISIAISDDGYGDYSIMTLIECPNNQNRLFNRLLIEDYTDGVIFNFS
jgi:hypothetical protein